MAPSSDAPRSTRRVRAAALLTILAVCAACLGAVPAHATPAPPSARAAALAQAADWVWPARPFRLEQSFVAPAHEYGPGHRGVDLRPLGGDVVVAPAAGVVAFSGQVAGRGILTIDHGGGLVTTLEPVASELAAGTPVPGGAEVGTVSTGGHAAPGTVHFGVRLNGDYINPLLLLGGVPRAVLLPCC
jgi:murein DD-endopeptidase MepM/ murein hydrolase activator NlpD